VVPDLSGDRSVERRLLDAAASGVPRSTHRSGDDRDIDVVMATAVSKDLSLGDRQCLEIASAPAGTRLEMALDMRCLLLGLACVLGGCLDRDPDLETTLTFHVSAPDGIAIDGIAIWVFYDDGTLQPTAPTVGDAYLPTAPVTPAMLAANQPPPAVALVGFARERNAIAAATSQSDADLVLEDPYIDLAGHQNDVMVVGYRTDTQPVRAVAALELTITSDQLPPNNGANGTIPVALDDSLVSEFFGTPFTWDNYDPTEFQPCVRVSGPASTRYFVASDDFDCDAIPNETDCKPSTYCDPSATSGPAYDACQCN
jgi:hypothetical protein